MLYYYTYYPKFRELEIPDKNLIGMYSPLEAPHSDREALMRDAFEHPVNSPKLQDLASPDDRVLIVLDDALEPTPTVFPFYHVVHALHEAGVSDANITVLIANVRHRAGSNEEVDRKIGAEMRRRFSVYQSALALREQDFHTFGTVHTSSGPVSVVADARLRDHSLIVGIGGTYPNRFKGFTGGGSLIFPGLGNERTIAEVYLTGASEPSSAILGTIENPARTFIRDLLAFVPAFKFCVDLVVDRTLNITACVAGAPTSVYRVSADVAARMFSFTVTEPADMVVIDSHPFDTNLFQASHALYAANGILKQGGEIIVVSPLLEAVSAVSGSLAANIKHERRDLLTSTEKGELSHHAVMGAQLAALREVVDRASRITFVSHGMGMADPAKFGFDQNNDAQNAFNAALSRKGKDARVALVTHGGLAVPRLG